MNLICLNPGAVCIPVPAWEKSVNLTSVETSSGREGLTWQGVCVSAPSLVHLPTQGCLCPPSLLLIRNKVLVLSDEPFTVCVLCAAQKHWRAARLLCATEGFMELCVLPKGHSSAQSSSWVQKRETVEEWALIKADAKALRQAGHSLSLICTQQRIKSWCVWYSKGWCVWCQPPTQRFFWVPELNLCSLVGYSFTKEQFLMLRAVAFLWKLRG